YSKLLHKLYPLSFSTEDTPDLSEPIFNFGGFGLLQIRNCCRAIPSCPINQSRSLMPGRAVFKGEVMRVMPSNPSLAMRGKLGRRFGSTHDVLAFTAGGP